MTYSEIFFFHIEPDPSQKETAPIFTEHLRNVSIQNGQPVTFDCHITAHPKPEVSWNKDGHKLTDSPRWKFIADDNHYTLLIYEANPSDSGTFEIVVQNRHGAAKSEAVLTITTETAVSFLNIIEKLYQ